jgi:hypothetical protein
MPTGGVVAGMVGVPDPTEGTVVAGAAPPAVGEVVGSPPDGASDPQAPANQSIAAVTKLILYRYSMHSLFLLWPSWMLRQPAVKARVTTYYSYYLAQRDTSNGRSCADWGKSLCKQGLCGSLRDISGRAGLQRTSPFEDLKPQTWGIHMARRARAGVKKTCSTSTCKRQRIGAASI